MTNDSRILNNRAQSFQERMASTKNGEVRGPPPTLTAHLCEIEPPAANKSPSIQEPAAGLPTKDP